jgi:hypothetical protein
VLACADMPNCWASKPCRLCDCTRFCSSDQIALAFVLLIRWTTWRRSGVELMVDYGNQSGHGTVSSSHRTCINRLEHCKRSGVHVVDDDE